MSEVKRYEFVSVRMGNMQIRVEAIESESGDYVKFADYEHLKTKLELTNKELGLNILSHLNDICTLEKLKAQLEKAESVLNKIQWLGHPERATFKQCEGMKLFRCSNCCSAEQANEYFKEKEQV